MPRSLPLHALAFLPTFTGSTTTLETFDLALDTIDWNTRVPEPQSTTAPSRYKQVEEGRLKEELSVLEQQYGIDHSQTFDVLRELGSVSGLQGRYKSADRTFMRLFHANRKKYGDNHLSTLRAVASLGKVYTQ